MNFKDIDLIEPGNQEADTKFLHLEKPLESVLKGSGFSESWSELPKLTPKDFIKGAVSLCGKKENLKNREDYYVMYYTSKELKEGIKNKKNIWLDNFYINDYCMQLVDLKPDTKSYYKLYDKKNNHCGKISSFKTKPVVKMKLLA